MRINDAHCHFFSRRFFEVSHATTRRAASRRTPRVHLLHAWLGSAWRQHAACRSLGEGARRVECGARSGDRQRAG